MQAALPSLPLLHELFGLRLSQNNAFEAGASSSASVLARPLTSHPGILIIGGGPAGLSLGYELQRRHLPYLIIERGESVGHSWHHMPSSLKLVSPWKANRLLGTRSATLPRHAQLSRDDYGAYLRNYASEHQLAVMLGTEIIGLRRNSGGFVVQTTQGDFMTSIVVNATGYFTNPFIPSIPGAERSSIQQVHYAAYQDTANLRRRLGRPAGRVLIVGRRLSAGQTMLELGDAGFEVALSCTLPIEFGPGPVAWWFAYRALPWLEWLKLRLKGPHAQHTKVLMQGGRTRRLIESGSVRIFPPIRQFENQQIVFSDGTLWNPELVIYATGFRPALRHLEPLGLALNQESGAPSTRGFESAEVQGLFFLGIDQLRNFQSRFLRGIRRDAVALAEHLVQRRAEWKI